MRFIPIRVEFIYHRKEFEYIGFSTLFEEREEGSEAPEYTIVSETKHNEVVNVRAIIVKYKNIIVEENFDWKDEY